MTIENEIEKLKDISDAANNARDIARDAYDAATETADAAWDDYIAKVSSFREIFGEIRIRHGALCP